MARGARRYEDRSSHVKLLEQDQRYWQEKFCLAFLANSGERLPEYKAFDAINFPIDPRTKDPRQARRQIVKKWLADPWVVDRISALMAERRARLSIDTDYVLIKAQQLLAKCMGDDYVRKSVITKDGDVFEEEVRHFDAQGAKGALEIIGKHVDVQAFREKVEIDVTGDLASSLQSALARRQRAAEIQGVEYAEVIENALPAETMIPLLKEAANVEVSRGES